MLYQLSYASSLSTRKPLPEADLFADTLQLSAYTAQKSRLAHRSTASKRTNAPKKAPRKSPKNAFPLTLPVTLSRR